MSFCNIADRFSWSGNFFSTKLHSLLGGTWKTVLWGIAGGLLASLLLLALGASIQPEAVLLLWAVTLIMLLFRIRYLCAAYSAGVLGILHGIVSWIPSLQESQSLQWFVGPVMRVDISSLLAIVGVLHLVEAVLMRVQGTRRASPIFYESKRGKIVGGYLLQGYWPVPLFLIVPLQGGFASEIPWAGWLNGNSWAGGWTMAALPVMVGFVEMTITRLPGRKLRLSSGNLLQYSIIVIVLAIGTHYWPGMGILAALLTIGLHEAMAFYSAYLETQKSPYFVHPSRGSRSLPYCLAALPRN